MVCDPGGWREAEVGLFAFDSWKRDIKKKFWEMEMVFECMWAALRSNCVASSGFELPVSG